MNLLIYWLGRLLVGFLQSLPLNWVARMGRVCGALVYRVDARHRKVVLQNLTMCFGKERTKGEIEAIARENFRRILEGYFCAVKTMAMTAEQLQPHLEFSGVERLRPPRRVVVAIGHFGNFEIQTRVGDHLPEYASATTYRALKQAGLNRLMIEMRKNSKTHFFERRQDAAQLRQFMSQPAALVGILSDQHGGAKGIRGPFLGHDCSTTPAAPIFALRYDCELYTGVCQRIGLAKWRLELGEQIPTRENGKARPVEDLVHDINRHLEQYVRRDPANWFWVHKRWKPPEKAANREANPS
jgi:lauroyl/myristoyl acyltransferase